MTPIALQTRDLSFSYHGTPVLHDLNLTFEKGRLTAVLGPNGSGKTTLLRLLNGLLVPDSGSVILGGKTLCDIPRKERAQQITFLPQDRPIPDIPAEMLVRHGRFPHLGLSRKLTASDRHIVETAMARTGALNYADRPLPSLSGGERQRVYLAMLLAQDTDILLLDEPTTYLDARHKFETIDLLRQLADSGKTVITVLHDLPLALSAADHVILLENGTCAAAGTPQALYADGVLNRVFGIRIDQAELNGRTVFIEQPHR